MPNFTAFEKAQSATPSVGASIQRFGTCYMNVT